MDGVLSSKFEPINVADLHARQVSLGSSVQFVADLRFLHIQKLKMPNPSFHIVRIYVRGGLLDKLCYIPILSVLDLLAKHKLLVAFTTSFKVARRAPSQLLRSDGVRY